MKISALYILVVALFASVSVQAIDKNQVKTELQKWLQNFGELDTNKDQELCKNELQKAIPQDELKSYKKVLKKLDTDKSQSISKDELKAVLK